MLLEIKSVEESKNALPFKEKSALRVIKPTLSERMLIIYSMSLENLERRRLVTKTRSID